MKKILYIIMFSSIQIVFAQVGVGPITPTETLQVAGNTKLSGELTLENPGEFPTNVKNYQRYLIVDTSGELKRYRTGNGPNKAKYSPLNVATYIFENIGTDECLQEFDTRIPADLYIVSIESYEFSDTNTIFQSTTGTDSVNGKVFRAFRLGGTWHLSFYGNDSDLAGYNGSTLNLELKVIIYRNKLLIADDGTTINVNMNGNTTGSAAKPTGY